MMRPAHARRGFTLLELLIVITIIAVLAAMLFPVTGSIIEQSRTVACASNLRQLWTAVNASATDHDNTFPVIKITPTDTPDEEGALELKDALKPYGITEKNLQCAADLKGPNWFAQVNTSYRWLPIVEEENASAIKVYTRRRAMVARPPRVPMLQDYDSVHPAGQVGQGKTMNTIYVDGHVRLR